MSEQNHTNDDDQPVAKYTKCLSKMTKVQLQEAN